MPLMTLDVTPLRKRRCWPFLAASFALHAALLGLDFGQGVEMRFFAPEHSISVSLVAAGARQEKAEEKGAGEQSVEAVSVKEVAHASTPTVSRYAAPEKKRANPPKIKPAPQGEPAREQNSPAGKETAPGKADPHSSQGATVERTIGVGDAPSFARFVPPEYPHQARARNIEGRVLLRVLVGAEGRAKEIEVVESSHPAFTKAARKSAQRSRYVPLTQQGMAEDVWVLIPFQFTLK